MADWRVHKLWFSRGDIHRQDGGSEEEVIGGGRDPMENILHSVFYLRFLRNLKTFETVFDLIE